MCVINNIIEPHQAIKERGNFASAATNDETEPTQANAIAAVSIAERKNANGRRKNWTITVRLGKN